ncbi:MAG: zf-HC2 domain-containing protein [Tunicatimonas sp.]
MNTPPQTTEFSAHLSWAGMRRYLQEELSTEKSQQVERHLNHCPRCSSAILEYIRLEEPEHYKEYTKKLKGIVKTSQAEKKSMLSSFQMKAVRTTTAVVALLIFSFFALKTVINKQADYSLPAESLAVAEQHEKVAPARRRPVKKVAKAAVVEPAAEVVPKVTKKAITASERKTPPAEAPAVITKARTATVTKTAAVAAPAPQEQPQRQPQPPVANVSTDSPTPPVVEEEAPAKQEEVAEAPANETASRKPLPTLHKIKTTESSAAVAPLGGSTPTEMPVPSNEILER